MSITIQKVAELLGVSAQTVRIGLRQGAFPFGTAFKAEGGKSYTYVIFPKKFEEYVGGVGNEEIQNQEKQPD